MSTALDAMARGNLPRVTVVTPSYNQASYIEETIRSVLDQDYPNIEYMVIDGGSTDGSVDIIRRYEHRLAYWVSEPDRGQSHAINKGWQRATGDIVAYLNSDDVYTSGAIGTAVRALMSHPGAAFVYSDALLIDEHGKGLRKIRGRTFDLQRLVAMEDWYVPPQPTAFIRRDALAAVGLLDERLHMVMDYDLWIRLGLRYAAVYLPGEYLAKMREHTAAKSTAAITKFPIEKRRMLNKLFARPDLPAEIRRLRGRAYGKAAFEQAKLAAYIGRSREIVRPLVRAFIGSPTYVARRPLAYYLLVRGLLGGTGDDPGRVTTGVYRHLDRIVESLRA